ncbi:Arabinose import ATP-binding protein AraG [Planctomycetes bacterium Poly30]|uniref:Arabinose import ATP-binding protein AraG n=1 Tax=Saltatorellus ferox TaxID=2528018 RepID=A0A518ESJ8_9BACT|nr:Arabinose import ATP-binding protein AraG [Planctomycetes bacterium Poly30]
MTVAPAPQDSCVTARGVTKVFPGVVAVADVDFRVRRGEIVALVGENGAGKSTLMKMIAGQYPPTQGTVECAPGVRVALVHQELCLADNLTAGQNVCLGREPSRWGFIQERALHERADVALQRLGADFQARTPLAELSIGQRQLVEIAKALDQQTDVLILDEPTSSLTQTDSDRLLEVLKRLKEEGIAILYVSHRLPEITSVADRAVVLRDGRRVGELVGAELTREALVQLMIGRAEGHPPLAVPRPEGTIATVLELDGFATEAWPAAVQSLQVGAGEIVGLAGLVGAGRTELLETVAGLRPAHAGTLRLKGTDLAERSVRERIDLGMGFVPEDRAGCGLFTGGPVDENLTLPSAHRRSKGSPWPPGGWLVKASESREYVTRAEQLDVRAASPKVAVNSLSGGNQQKILVGRWINEGLALLMLDEPTRGVDVGAREGIYHVVEELARQGAGVLFASSDLEEVRRLAHRIVVMRDGRIVGELPQDEATEAAVMNLATGTTSHRVHTP